MMYLLAIVFHLSLAHAAPPSLLKRQIYARLTVIAKKLDLNVRLNTITAATLCNCAMKPANPLSDEGMPLSSQQRAEVGEITRVASHRISVQFQPNDDNETLHILTGIYNSVAKADVPVISGKKYQFGFKVHGARKIKFQATVHF